MVFIKEEPTYSTSSKEEEIIYAQTFFSYEKANEAKSRKTSITIPDTESKESSDRRKSIEFPETSSGSANASKNVITALFGEPGGDTEKIEIQLPEGNKIDKQKCLELIEKYKMQIEKKFKMMLNLNLKNRLTGS